MFDFIKKNTTVSVSIVTIIFTFVPESFFSHIWSEKISDWINGFINRILMLSAVFIFVFFCRAIYYTVRKKVIIKDKHYSIQIEYGDIFDIKDNCKKVIPFDECFTVEIGDEPSLIKKDSVCGQYLLKYPIVNIDEILKKSSIKPSKERSNFQSKEKYPSGFLVPRDDYLLMSFAKLDEDGLGWISREEYIDCLSILWKEINKYYAQKDIYIPIIGAGTTRMKGEPLSQQELLDIIIASYKLSSYKLKSPCKLHIICKKNDNFSINKIGHSI